MVWPRISVTASGLAALAWCTAGATSPSPDRGGGVEPATSTQESARPLPPPNERLLWSDSHPQEAFFVPEAVLNSRDSQEIPMAEDLRRELLWELRLRQNPFHPQTGRKLDLGCRPAREPARPGSASYAEDLLDAILIRDASVLATVDHVVPGWGRDYGGLETAVYGTVIEVFHDRTGTFKAGGEVSFLWPGGDLTVQRVRFCTEPSKGVHEPRPSDLLLIAGYASPVNPGLLYANTVFPVEEDALVPQAYEHIKGRMDWTVDELCSLRPYQRGSPCS